MTTDAGDPKEMDTYLALAEQRGLWHSVNHPEVQQWGQRVLAISLQKLVDVLVRSPFPRLSFAIFPLFSSDAYPSSIHSAPPSAISASAR
jgi:hypothetical protein